MKEFLAETRLVVQVKIAEKGFPAALGADIFDGVTMDIEENWSEDRFVQWTGELEAKYTSHTPMELLEAHRLVNSITAEHIKQHRIGCHSLNVIDRKIETFKFVESWGSLGRLAG